MNYRDYPHVTPYPGAEMPAFIVSEYDGGDKLLYSHGSFDIWCVYHAVASHNESIPYADHDVSRNIYPLKLETIRVRKIIGTSTDFAGFLSNAITVEYNGDASHSSDEYFFDAPKDIDYLQDVRNLANRYGRDRVWDSFLDLYNCIPQQRGISINRSMTRQVLITAAEYPKEPTLRLTLDCLLCAMIAENNRLQIYGSPYDTRLGKKVKALGVFQAIFEPEMTIRRVADYSKNKPWEWISGECSKRGIDTPNF